MTFTLLVKDESGAWRLADSYRSLGAAKQAAAVLASCEWRIIGADGAVRVFGQALQKCRDCGAHFPYSDDADRCAACAADAIGRQYVVIENTPGYMPDEEEPATFEDYADAVAYLNARAAEYADDPDANYRVEYGYASGDNLAAVMVWDDDQTHDLGRYIGIEIDHDA